MLSSSGAPYVWNISLQMDINLEATACPGLIRYRMSHPVSLSAQARYVNDPT